MSETDYKFEYIELLWGDLIYGSKAELESLGIAVGMQFPGEQGGPKRTLNVLDPRGFATKIQWASYRSQFSASVSFPGRERPTKEWEHFAKGVKVRNDCPWFDEYVGTADALCSVGLVLPGQFPGQPEMRKIRVTIFSDGSMPVGAKTTNHRERYHSAGAKTIERAAKHAYKVSVVVSEEEAERRVEANRIQRLEWEVRMQALLRPAPLKRKATFQQSLVDIAEYREKVRYAAENCFRLLEKYMFSQDVSDDPENNGIRYSPEVREAVLGHKKSLWQELSHLIDTGKIIKLTPDRKPVLSLIVSRED